MSLPFTIDQFMGVFVLYNHSVWPAQILLNLLALLAVVLCFRPGRPTPLVPSVLGALWIWTGGVYHLMFFSAINPIARVAGWVFILQGALFFYMGVMRHDLRFRYARSFRGITGGILILYALLLYPLIGYLLGHVYPYSPTFGAPCPTTIFTLGILLWTESRPPWFMLLIPILWSQVGSSAVLEFGIIEDAGLALAGLWLLAFAVAKSVWPAAQAHAEL